MEMKNQGESRNGKSVKKKKKNPRLVTTSRSKSQYFIGCTIRPLPAHLLELRFRSNELVKNEFVFRFPSFLIVLATNYLTTTSNWLLEFFPSLSLLLFCIARNATGIGILSHSMAYWDLVYHYFTQEKEKEWKKKYIFNPSLGNYQIDIWERNRTGFEKNLKNKRVQLSGEVFQGKETRPSEREIKNGMWK